MQIRARYINMYSEGEKKEKKMRVTQKEDLKENGGKMEAIPSIGRETSFFDREARALLLLSFKLSGVEIFSISSRGKNGNC